MLTTSRKLAAWVFSVALATPAVAAEPKTFFDYLESSWAVGTIHLSRPLVFRNGLLLAFPGKIKDLVRSRQGKPRSILLVYEIRDIDGSAPFGAGDEIFGPIALLPRYTYWRDNLPNGPHHQIPGGRRYIFKGEAIAPAAAVARSYSAAMKLEMPEKARSKVSALVAALDSELGVIAGDAVREIASYPVLERDLDEGSQVVLTQWLNTKDDVADRVKVITSLGARSVTRMAPALEKLSTRDDEVGAATLRALDNMGKPRSTSLLISLLDARTIAVRAFAAGSLGLRSKTDERAKERATALLGSEQATEVRAAAALGLGSAGVADSVDQLEAMLMVGDDASRAAAKALARIGDEKSIAVLKRAITEGPGEAMVGGVLAMVELKECPDCLKFLMHQYKNHKEKAVRELVGVLLEVDQGGHGPNDDRTSFH